MSGNDSRDIRTCILIPDPCPVCGAGGGVECGADWIGQRDIRWWECGRREERAAGGDWMMVRACGGEG